jgi:signal transduction histidine kinase
MAPPCSREAVSVAKGKSIGDLVFVSVVLFAPFVGGSLLHARREHERDLERRAAALERDGVRRAQEAVEAERSRIARELHDVVAHAMSVIVVQAGAERHVLAPEQESTRAVLEAIEHTSRQALGEMRRLLGMMRDTDQVLTLAPQPSLIHLPDLCQQMRSAGLPVALDMDGDLTDLPPGVDVSAYRIVQEALTNALKHAGPASARVVVRQRPGTLEVEVVDDGIGANGADSGGHGLVGMRERVTVYGGRLETGNRPSGGYAVRVHLPLGEPA